MSARRYAISLLCMYFPEGNSHSSHVLHSVIPTTLMLTSSSSILKLLTPWKVEGA